MSTLTSKIKKQYSKSGLFQDICDGLKEKGIDLDKLSRADISGVDEFHIRGAEVTNELVDEIYMKDTKVLDVGCGLGGPARMLAEKYNCSVSGVDLSEDYIDTARQLSDLTGLSKKTEFILADALSLPFEDYSFDVVWTQHVQMNIEDKTRFYGEISRVLKDEGALVYYDIFKKGQEEVNYPLPWANTASISFLESIKLVDDLLNKLGFAKLQTTNQTPKADQHLKKLLKNLEMNGWPVLGLNLLMGNSTMKKINNILKAIEENKIELQSGIYKKKNSEQNTVEF